MRAATQQLATERFINVSNAAPTLRLVIDGYVARHRLAAVTELEADDVTMAASRATSTGGVALLPAYALSLLPATVTSRFLSGPAPRIDLVLGYRREHTASSVELFRSHVDDFAGRVASKQRQQRNDLARACSDRRGSETISSVPGPAR